MLTVISLGAGVQSTTLALMAAHGAILPMPDCAIFADTQWEPQPVYDHLAWLCRPGVLPFPVHRVTAGNIRAAIRDRRNTSGGRFAAIPWHTVNPDGSHGLGRRQCSSEYKLAPIMREIRRLLGKPGRQYIAPGSVLVMLGISRDEAHRMKTARQAYMRNVYPLVELGMTRADCLAWLARCGYPTPPKSACIGCPFHDNDYWRAMRDERPSEWADAIAADRMLRRGSARGLRATEFMHRQRVPLAKVDLSPRTAPGFGNECEGLCGV
jgi:hypothetical protein